jgi:C-terminal processing protease CtpA/Prc
MKSRLLLLTSMILIFGLVLGACQPKTKTTVTPTAIASSATATTQPAEIKGDFTYTNTIIETYYVEQAVMLTDMHGFVVRDLEWVLPIDSQDLGFLQLDTTKKVGTYQLSLPARPQGTLNDVDNNGKTDKGVQIFAVAYSPNLTGGPFSEGDDKSYGWPGYLASVITDSENKEEVIGGKLIVWAPDDQQQFPTGYGTDGKLFTADDPEAPIPAGYSIVDLDATPFTITHDEVSTVKLYEPKDVAIKDFTKDTYVDAFNKMFDFVKTEYAFNGIEGKQPDWDKVYARVLPEVQAAQDAKDSKAFYLALRDFTYAFNDGHVGLSGGDVENQIFSDAISNGYGFAIRQLDDGRVMVVFVTSGAPAEKAGIKVGAVVTKFNDQPIADAIKAVQPLTLPASMDSSIQYQQARYLLRAPAGSSATVTFTNPGETNEQSVKLDAVAETDSYRFTSIMKGFDYNALPVEYQILNSQYGTIGYVKINSNYDDLNLIIRLFERALKTFTANNYDGSKVAGLVIDMRQNSGGANLGLAGFLTDKEIPMGLLEYYSSKTGKFEPEGVREKVLPNVNQYRFDKMAVLVDQACASACELEAYGFSQVPGMEVIGTSPSSGTEAEVARGQIYLPDNFFLQVPTGRFKLPDGSIFLEGKGVQLTYRIPVDESLVLSTSSDPVLEKAIAALMAPKGAGIVPAGNPVIGSVTASEAAMNGGSAKYLEQLAVESYDNPIISGKTYPFTISLSASKEVIWGWGWCASDKATTDENYQHINIQFTLNGKGVSPDQVAMLEQEGGGMFCRSYGMSLDNWPAGEHHLQTVVTFDAKINDGTADYDAGSMTYDYTVYVAPK